MKSDRIRSFSGPYFLEYLSVFSPNAGKCGPEKLQIWTLFTEWNIWQFSKYPHVRCHKTLLVFTMELSLGIFCMKWFKNKIQLILVQDSLRKGLDISKLTNKHVACNKWKWTWKYDIDYQNFFVHVTVL